MGITFNEQQITITKLNEPSAFFVCFHSLSGTGCTVSLIAIQNGRLTYHQDFHVHNILTEKP